MGTLRSTPVIGNYPIQFAVGEVARQANGSVLLTYGETVILVTACMADTGVDSERDFFPLTVEYQERTYAMGKIPGGFIKREGRPKDKEILSSRLIDRPLRPLFPFGLVNEVQIIAMVLCSDKENDPDVQAINAASCALMISDIPFEKPCAAVRISMDADGRFILNPAYSQREISKMDFIIAGTEEKIVMMEGGFLQINEQTVFEAIKFGHQAIKQIIETQKQLRIECGKSKKDYTPCFPDKIIYETFKDEVFAQMEAKVYGIVNKEERAKALNSILSDLYQSAIALESLKEIPRNKVENEVKKVFSKLEEDFLRYKILISGKRPDNREFDEIRPIFCNARFLPRTHGSALFTRGQTQSLAVVTLGSTADEQTIEALEGTKSKHFMLHYSFPPFSVGEVKMMRGPSRRDIGHGALAERALSAVVPTAEEFPYTIRVVSEILESNGSSSMATVCASTLSLMDAGVPIKAPVAGIAMGMVSNGDRDFKILTDIAGIEDHYGDMDYKVAGTKDGITAIQLDVKIDGLTFEMVENTLQKAKKARLFILNKMETALSVPREDLSKYAPKIKSMPIDADKIGAVIGPGGKTIRKLSKDFNVSIDINDELGLVSVVAELEEDLNRAFKAIKNMISDVEVGNVYEEAKVVKLMNFGAFCEIAPGKDGLVHVSEISDQYVKDVASILKEGDIVKVKVIAIDAQGRINLSIKQAK